MSRLNGVRWKSIELKGERRLTAGLVHHRWPAFSRDGQWLVFAAAGGHDATWVLTDRRGRVARTFDEPADGGASFGDAGTLAFGRRAGATSEIWLTPGSGAPAVRLLGGDGRLYREPAWSPDGQTLAYAAADDDKTPTRLELLDVPSGKRRVLLHDGRRAAARPAFSPDGTELYFEGSLDGDVAVFAQRLDGGDAVRVTAAGAISRRPAPLSHDLLIIERPVDGGATHLVLIDRITVRERDLTPDGAEHREPSVLRTRSGKFRLAYIAMTESPSGEPRRFDVCVARLRGVQIGESESLPALVEVPPVATGDSTAAA
jgi:dipeptidyl aminopeptidase/acylaminoacyl peptidase